MGRFFRRLLFGVAWSAAVPLTASALSPVLATADSIFFAGTVVTVDPSRPETEGLAVKDGKILSLGTSAEVKRFQGASTRMIDLQGKTLMPGFFEPHGHPFDSAFAQFFAVDIRPFTVKTAAELLQKIKTAVSQAKPGEWVVLNGLDILLQKDVTAPTLEQMDQWAPANPLLIINNSGHAAYANSLAFQKAGVTAQTPDPPGSRILKTADGKLTGTVEEIPAMTLLLDPVLNTITPEKNIELLRRYEDYLASRGITTVSDMAFDAKTLPVYQALAKDPGVQVRVRLYEIARKDNRGALPPMGGDDLVRQNGIKWWTDGSPWLGTIAVSPPYENTPTTLQVMGLGRDHTGPLNYKNTADLQKWVEAYYQQGYQIAIHTEGELAIAQSLEVISATAKKFPARDHRMRLEHVPLITEAQLDEVHRLNIPISFLMGHIYYWGDLLPAMFGAKRADHYNPDGSALKKGIVFSFHNDGAVTPADPLLDLKVAVLRQTESGRVLGAGQAIDIDAAIRARTLNAAHELFMEKQAGSLEPGKWADLVILSGDPRKTKAEEIPQLRVIGTYLNGKPVWPRPAP